MIFLDRIRPRPQVPHVHTGDRVALSRGRIGTVIDTTGGVVAVILDREFRRGTDDDGVREVNPRRIRGFFL